MNDQSHTIRFSLRAIFICTTLVGIGVLTLKYPYSWVLCLVNLAVAVSIVFALIFAVASKGNHQLFRITYSVMAVTILLMTQQSLSPFLPYEWADAACKAIHPVGTSDVYDTTAEMYFVQIIWRWELVAISTAAAYTIPWLVTRRHTAPQ